MMQIPTDEQADGWRRVIDLVAYTARELGVSPEEAARTLNLLMVEGQDDCGDYPDNDCAEESEDLLDHWVNTTSMLEMVKHPPKYYQPSFDSPLCEDNLRPRIIKDSKDSLVSYKLIRSERGQWFPVWTGIRRTHPRMFRSLNAWNKAKWIIEFGYSDE